MTKLLEVKKYSKEIILRFWEKVDIRTDEECWNWTAGVQSKGYGSFGIGNKKTALAHRVAFEIAYGVIPESMCVCHQEDNRLCCNPSHLFLESIAGNNRDMVKKGRQAKGIKNGRSVLTNEMVVTMRSDFQSGKTIRELSEDYDIHYNTARNAIQGNTWRDLPLAE